MVILKHSNVHVHALLSPQWQDEEGRKKEDSKEKFKSQVEDTMGEKIRIRREVIHGQKSWQDL